MPDEGGRFRGISVPELPWERDTSTCSCSAVKPGACAIKAGGKTGPGVRCKQAEPDRRYSALSGRERQEAIRESNQRAGGDYYGG